MALDEAGFERISSTRVFLAMRAGAVRRQQLLEDLFGFLRRDVLMAQGATFSDAPGPPKPGTPTFERLMGRAPVPYVDPPEQTPEDEERAREAHAEAEGKRARAQMMLYEAAYRRAHPEQIAATEPGPSPE